MISERQVLELTSRIRQLEDELAEARRERDDALKAVDLLAQKVADLAEQQVAA